MRIGLRAFAAKASGAAALMVLGIMRCGCFSVAWGHDGRHEGQTLFDHIMTSLVDLGSLFVLSLPLIAGLHLVLQKSGKAKVYVKFILVAIGCALFFTASARITGHALNRSLDVDWYHYLAVWFLGAALIFLGLLSGRRAKA